MAGASNDQNEAAIITPAAKPSAMSSDFLCKMPFLIVLNDS